MSRTSSDVKNRCNVNQTCLNCGGDLGRNKYYCSQKCRAEYIRNHKKCVICGKYFYASPSSEKKTCSKACEKIERATIGKIGKSAQNLINAQKAAALSPNSGRFETNAIAKSWVVQSPDGTIYNINNLSLWASEHADMLPGTPTQFSYGIRSIKRTSEASHDWKSQASFHGLTHPCWAEPVKRRFPVAVFRYPLRAPAQGGFPFRGNGLPFHHTGSSQPAVTPSAAGVNPCSSAMSLISVDKVFVLLWASSGTFAVTACPTVAGRVFKRSRIKYRAPML